MNFRSLLIALALALFAAACTCSPLDVDSQKYACQTSADCGEGLSCISGICGGPTETDAGNDAGVDAGDDAGFDAGMDAGDDGGFDAGFDAGMDAGDDGGFDAGNDAGVDAGDDGGFDAGFDAGVDAGTDAGVDAGFDAGVDAGNDAGTDAGTDAGVDAGFVCHSDDDCAAQGGRCSIGSGVCVSARVCNVDLDCSSASASDYCFSGGRQCRCVAGANDAGANDGGSDAGTGLCRRRHGPCEPCSSDLECGGLDGGFAPPGACLSLDGGAAKVCAQQAAVCPSGSAQNDAGFCLPVSGSCTTAGCASDLDCPADTSCSLGTTPVCEPRCRWSYALGAEDPPGCAAGSSCFVDDAQLDAGSALFAFGRCRTACVNDAGCAASVANPFGGTHLMCAPEVLLDGGASLNRCRSTGCMDDLQCTTAAGLAPKGYCDRFSASCATNCRLATDPVTTLPYADCRAGFSCQIDGGSTFCLP